MINSDASFYRSLAETLDPYSDPIAAQLIPRAEERVVLHYESTDPIADKSFELSHRLIHRYYDRALLLANDTCAMYCRHCFRQHFTHSKAGEITEKELQAACSQLQQHPEIHEILISGGDPLYIESKKLQHIINSLRSIRSDYIIRISTRIPIVKPNHIPDSFFQFLAEQKHIWIVVQVNHPKEISLDFSRCIERIRKTGTAVVNQSVLLRGVNDSVEIQETLLRKLLQNGIKPYYLFQGDLAAGTSHFRVNLEKGITIMQRLRNRLSSLAMPVYAVDIPNTWSKIALHDNSIFAITNGWYQLHGPNNETFKYPCEHMDERP